MNTQAKAHIAKERPDTSQAMPAPTISGLANLGSHLDSQDACAEDDSPAGMFGCR